MASEAVLGGSIGVLAAGGFLAYAVLNDAATSDGSYVGMSF